MAEGPSKLWGAVSHEPLDPVNPDILYGTTSTGGARCFFMVLLGEQGGDGGLHLAAEFCAVSRHLLSPAIICPLLKSPTHQRRHTVSR